MLKVFILAALPFLGYSKYTTGKVSTSDTFIFLDSFCFARNTNASKNNPGNDGSLEYHIYENNAPVLELKTYVDEFLGCTPDSSDPANCKMWSWSYVYGTKSLTCAEKASHNDGGHNVTGTASNLTTYFGDWSRPHYWYLAVANCEAKKIEFKYTLKWLQPDGSQYSQDDHLQKGIMASFFVFYLFLSAAVVYGNFFLSKENGKNAIVRLVVIDILVMLLGVFCLMIHWAVYGSNGVGVPFFSIVGQILVYFDRIVFMFMLVLISHGWSITRVALPDKKILFGLLGVFTLLYTILFFWQQFGVNPAKTLTVYQSWPGGLLLFVTVVTALYFAWSMWGTLKETTQADKKSFFMIFGIVYFLWFLSIPVIASIMAGIDPWVRDDVTSLVELIVVFAAQAGIAFLLWPSRADKYFITSTQDMLLEDKAPRGDYGAL